MRPAQSAINKTICSWCLNINGTCDDKPTVQWPNEQQRGIPSTSVTQARRPKKYKWVFLADDQRVRTRTVTHRISTRDELERDNSAGPFFIRTGFSLNSSSSSQLHRTLCPLCVTYKLTNAHLTRQLSIYGKLKRNDLVSPFFIQTFPSSSSLQLNAHSVFSVPPTGSRTCTQRSGFRSTLISSATIGKSILYLNCSVYRTHCLLDG